MNELINKIINKDYEGASKSLKEEIASLVEKKLSEKKKMMTAGNTPFKTDVERTGSVKAERKPLKGVTRVLKDVKEAVVHKDGLVHLNTGEKVLPSVFKQRRGLMEGADNVSPADDWSENWHDRHDDLKRKLKDDATNPARKAVQMHLDKARKHMKKGDTDDAESHLRDAESLFRKSHGKDIKEDCGLAPDKEALLHAALEKARMLIEPKLDTTPPPIDRSKMSIPKGMRPADRLTCPDTPAGEEKWTHGKNLDEMKGDAQYDRPDPLANRAFEKKLTKKGKMTKDSLRTAKWAAMRNLEDLKAQKKPNLKEAILNELKLKTKISAYKKRYWKNMGQDPEDDADEIKKGESKLKDTRNSIYRSHGSEGVRAAKRSAESTGKGGHLGHGRDPMTVNPRKPKGKKLVKKERETAKAVHRGKLEGIKAQKAPNLKEALEEAVSRKHFRDVANLLKEIPDEGKRKELAHHHAGIFAKQNPRFDKKKFLTAAGVKHENE